MKRKYIIVGFMIKTGLWEGKFRCLIFYLVSETHFLVRKTTKMATDSGTSYYQVNTDLKFDQCVT